MISAAYKRTRRKVASLLNGWLMPKLGLKLERSWPKRFQYEKLSTRDGVSIVSVRNNNPPISLEVQLREGSSDWMTFDQIFVEEDYDLRSLSRYSELLSTFKNISRNDVPLIIDLGANIGLSALYFNLIWPGSRIVAIEPDLSNFKMMQRNVSSQGAIDPIGGAAASSPNLKLSVIDSGAGKNAIRTGISQAGSETVPAITVLAILDDYATKGCKPFAIKIDIEGAEEELFSENTEWIDEFPLIIIELHDWLYPNTATSRNFLAAISKHNRDFVYLDENIFSIRNDVI